MIIILNIDNSKCKNALDCFKTISFSRISLCLKYIIQQENILFHKKSISKSVKIG